MRGGRFILALFLVVLVIPLVFGQETSDLDVDGVADSVDKCTLTNPEEGLPVITQNEEYLGCSCSQIYSVIRENHCFDIFCSTGRPLLIRARTYSSRENPCGKDYCVNGTFYDYTELQIRCVDGKEEEFSCEPVQVENSDLCNGDYLLQEQVIKNNDDSLNLVLLDDYEKLEKRAFSLASSDPIIKSGLGISSEQNFLEMSKKISDAVIIEKSTLRETKIIGNSEKVITTKTLKLKLENYKKAYNVYVFEEIPRGANLEGRDVIPNPEVVLQEEGPVLLIWKIDNLKEDVELSYQINKPFEGESNTLIVAREVNSTEWRLLFIPLAIIILVIGIFIYVSEKSVPRRKKIFKE